MEEFGNMERMPVEDVGKAVLGYMETYEEKIPPQYRELLAPLLAPGARLGIATGTNVAEQINALQGFIAFFEVKPPALQGVGDLMYELVVSALEPVLNTAKDGRLLQVVTGRRVEPDIPPWLTRHLFGEMGDTEEVESK